MPFPKKALPVRAQSSRPVAPPVFRAGPAPHPQAIAGTLQRKPAAPLFRPPPPPFARPPTIQRTVTGARSYVVAVEGSDDLSLIHRVEPASQSAGTVQVYLTVFAYADNKHKDVHADDTGGIKLIAKTHDTMMNIGAPRRAFHYVNTYGAQGATCPIIRCFEITRELYDRITGNALSESQRKALGRDRPYNVDKERGQNQFGVPPHARDEALSPWALTQRYQVQAPPKAASPKPRVFVKPPPEPRSHSDPSIDDDVGLAGVDRFS